MQAFRKMLNQIIYMHWKCNTKDYLKSQEQQANTSKSLM